MLSTDTEGYRHTEGFTEIGIHRGEDTDIDVLLWAVEKLKKAETPIVTNTPMLRIWVSTIILQSKAPGLLGGKWVILGAHLELLQC